MDAKTSEVTLPAQLELFQITLLEWAFLGEQLAWQKVMGMAVASLGTHAVQIHKQP